MSSDPSSAAAVRLPLVSKHISLCSRHETNSLLIGKRMYCTALHHITMVGLLLGCVNIIEQGTLLYKTWFQGKEKKEVEVRLKVKVGVRHVALMVRVMSMQNVNQGPHKYRHASDNFIYLNHRESCAIIFDKLQYMVSQQMIAMGN